MEKAIKNYEDVDSWKTIMFLYNSALKEVGTKLEILNDESLPYIAKVALSHAEAGADIVAPCRAVASSYV